MMNDMAGRLNYSFFRKIFSAARSALLHFLDCIFETLGARRQREESARKKKR